MKIFSILNQVMNIKNIVHLLIGNSFDDIESYINIFYKEIKRKLDKNIKSLYDSNIISKYMFEGELKPYKGSNSSNSIWNRGIKS